jgi:hypothetical protein
MIQRLEMPLTGLKTYKSMGTTELQFGVDLLSLMEWEEEEET